VPSSELRRRLESSVGTEPDLIIELPVEWRVTAEGEMPNFNLYSRLPFTEAKLVEAVQVRAGNVAATQRRTVTSIQTLVSSTRRTVVVATE
jgi:hypothetical protein